MNTNNTTGTNNSLLLLAPDYHSTLSSRVLIEQHLSSPASATLPDVARDTIPFGCRRMRLAVPVTGTGLFCRPMPMACGLS
ncbi:hypothetical protein GMORB2_3382 [Geosmithia morbida]|uniref:Uncharacterized protein n=1 Tax=Geosmithia morbida TaxID=1094350 RepID=A0A9P5D107_9HYPO|nr:uncharacterized protein GMORB2_3382 [Geosmithia morbida]KAF4119971.1 hypothetical protein GMORB2_3382 [Geosmithia morbida]